MADEYAGLEQGHELSSNTESSAQEMMAAASATGLSTLFCCLSCWMPYAFPDHAYMTDDKQVGGVVANCFPVFSSVTILLPSSDQGAALLCAQGPPRSQKAG